VYLWVLQFGLNWLDNIFSKLESPSHSWPSTTVTSGAPLASPCCINPTTNMCAQLGNGVEMGARKKGADGSEGFYDP